VKARPAITFWFGLALILACEMLLLVDVRARGVPVLPAAAGEVVRAPAGALESLARWTAINLTPLCWVGFLLVLDGVLAALGRRGRPGSPARTRPRRFAVCFATSVGVWLFFDWVNFSFIHAWTYHAAEPLTKLHEYVAKFVAFGAISPAMFMAAELFSQLGLRRVRGPALAVTRPWQVAMLVAGVPALGLPFVLRDPVACFGLWVSLVLVLDPLNHWLGRGAVPTLIGDWRAGRWGRTLSLMAGGLACGFFWEFWNYWAGAKWTYHLPFLGPLQGQRLFEMPWPGFGGFPPFALECWVVFQTILLVLRGLRPGLVEPLPDDDAVL
jgi:hypothetical protein